MPSRVAGAYARQVLQMGELLSQQEDMMRLQAADDRLGKGLSFGPHPPPRQLGQRLCVGLALEEPLQDLPRRETADVGHD